MTVGPQKKIIFEPNGYLKLSLHWIRGKGSLSKLKALVREFIPGDWQFEEKEQFLLQRRWMLSGPHGVKIGFEKEGGKKLDPILEFPGQACDVLGPAAWILLRRLEWRGLNRVDLALDGWTRNGAKVSPKDLYQMVEADRDSLRSRIDRDCVTMTCRVSGEQTVYFGSRQSERFVRIYNRREETRVEMQLAGRYVQSLGMSLWGGENMKKMAMGLLRDHIEFVEPGCANISRAALQPWWSSYVERWDRCRVAAAKVSQTLDGCFDWMKRQMSAMLATLVVAAGGSIDLVDQLLAEGMSKMGVRHRQLVACAGPAGWSPGSGRGGAG